MWQRKKGAGQINPYVQHTDPSDNKLKRSAQSNTIVEVEIQIEQVKKEECGNRPRLTTKKIICWTRKRDAQMLNKTFANK